ncbi:MAG: hypothetical protein JKX81_11230 [Arenicella sp.]|nr:hypothetical protein [Arenicella sp.]
MKTKKVTIGSSEIDVALHRGANYGRSPLFWASLGEYPVYDVNAYRMMTTDRVRTSKYFNAVNKFVSGKVVLDIGTGADLNWTLASVEAGAKKVYAIEEILESYEKASAKIIDLGLEDKISLIYGKSLEVNLPEKVDVCVSEIIGTIGSSEGVCVALADARKRFMKPDAVMIPERCATKIAAVMLPDELYSSSGFDDRPFPLVGLIPMKSVEDVMNSIGYPFDCRLCISDFPQTNILSTSGVIEDLFFDKEIKSEYNFETSLEITKPGRLDGFLLWINLWVDLEGGVIDSYNQQTSWAPVYFPAFGDGVSVIAGDEIEINCEMAPSSNGVNPDYKLRGKIKTTGRDIEWKFDSFHQERRFREGHLYKKLFPLHT